MTYRNQRKNLFVSCQNKVEKQKRKNKKNLKIDFRGQPEILESWNKKLSLWLRKAFCATLRDLYFS